MHQESSASQGQTYPPLAGHAQVRTGAKTGSICACADVDFEVEFHTRISVSAGSSTPKSRSTPRGSTTAREGSAPICTRPAEAPALPTDSRSTDDHVVELGRVLHNSHVLSLETGVAERSNCGRRSHRQPPLKLLIDPRLGDDSGPRGGKLREL